MLQLGNLTNLGPAPILHSGLIFASVLEEVRLPACGGCLGYFAPEEPFVPTDQYIWIRRVVSPSPLCLVSCNLLFEISTHLLHSGPATKVRVADWVQVVEMEENKEAGARQEDQQALVHGCHHLGMRLPFTDACLV